MEYEHYDYAVIGGDIRQVYLAEEFADNKKSMKHTKHIGDKDHTDQKKRINRVCHFALCAKPDEQRDYNASPITGIAAMTAVTMITAADSLEEICRTSSCVICPIPFSRDGVYLNQSAFDKALPIDLILSNLQPGQLFFAGCIPEYFKAAATEKGVHVVDLMQNTSLAYFNSIATAEGAICEAIKRSSLNLHQSSCAVLGYGKCGRTIASYLKGMFCNLFVASEQEEERAQAVLAADRTGDLADFGVRAQEFDFIFNTIPSVVITSECLMKMKSTVTIIDIASAPGGVDYTAAQKLEINATFCPGLPGKYAPYSSARAIKETIEQIITRG